jgi:hypothetical protein
MLLVNLDSVSLKIGRTWKNYEEMVSSPPQSWTSKPTGFAFLYRDLVRCHDESTESPAEHIPEVPPTNQQCNKIQDADLPFDLQNISKFKFQ